jgi:hypothetical protein
MRIQALAAAAAALALTTAALPAQAQTGGGMTPEQTAEVKAGADAAVQTYYRFFREHNMKALPEQSFTIPWILLGGNGPQFNLTKEEALGRFEGSLKNLIASGWGKSEYTTEHVCALNPGAAIVSGYNTRYKTDGSVMSVGGVSYILSKTPEGWKIISYTSLPKGKLVKCD